MSRSTRSRTRRAASAAVPAASPRSRLHVALAFAIVAVGFAAYANSFRGPFIWDDDPAIVTNHTIQRLSDAWWPPIETPVAGRPIVNVTLAINYALGGLSVAGYHAMNLVVHVACALVLFGIVRRTLVRVRIHEERGWNVDALAGAAALLWVVHPLLSEVVDYVTQRTESLMGLFWLLTLYASIRALDTPYRRRWTIAAIAACAIGIATKESMATAPIAVLLYDRVFVHRSVRDAVRERSALYLGLAATWIELALVMLTWPRSTVGVATVTPWRYLLNQLEMIAIYLRLAVWPHALVLDYGLPRALTLHDVAWPALLVLAALTAVVVSMRRWPRVGFLGAVFFLTLAPTSSIVPIVSEAGAERRMYLPLAALAVLLVVSVRLAIDRVAAQRPAHRRLIERAAVAVAALAVVTLAARTAFRNAEYATAQSVWRTVVERRPNGRARMAYAIQLADANQRADAIRELRVAATDYPEAHAALGAELYFDKRFDEAVRETRQFIDASPSNPNRLSAHVLLGQALEGEGRFDDAVREFRTVLAAEPSNPFAQAGLADIGREYRTRAAAALQKDQPAEAADNARRALAIDARDAEAHNLLGVAFATRRQAADAIAEFRTATQLDPTNARARNNLQRALALVGSR